MTETIKELITKRDFAIAEAKKFDDAIKSLQATCNHKTEDGKDAFVLEGNDSHYKYYECSICLKEEKV